MAKAIINEMRQLINDQIEVQQTLREYLGKAFALLEIALTPQFLNNSQITIELYFWTMFDLLHAARMSNNQSIKTLIALHQS